MKLRLDESLDQILFILQIITLCLSVFFNGIGLFAIYSYHKRINQNIILGALSYTQIFYVTAGVLFRICIEQKVSQNFLKTMLAIQWAQMFALVLCMYILSLDRLVCIINPLRYKSRLTRKRIGAMILITCILSMVVGLLTFVRSSLVANGMFIVMIVLHVVYMVYATTTYCIAFFVIRRSTNMFGTSQEAQSKKIKKILFVPGLLMLTFIIFYIIPLLSMLPEFKNNRQGEAKFQICKIVNYFGSVADPITYVWLTKHYRKALASKVRQCRSMFPFIDENVSSNDVSPQQTLEQRF